MKKSQSFHLYRSWDIEIRFYLQAVDIYSNTLSSVPLL